MRLKRHATDFTLRNTKCSRNTTKKQTLSEVNVERSRNTTKKQMLISV